MEVRTPVDFGLMIRQARRFRRMTQKQLARRAAVGRQWIVEIEGGKRRAELGKVLQTLAALDLSLTIAGPGVPEAGDEADAVEHPVDVRAVVNAHRLAEQ